MGVSLIHVEIAKVLDHTKLRRDVTMYGGEGEFHLHQSVRLANV